MIHVSHSASVYLPHGQRQSRTHNNLFLSTPFAAPRVPRTPSIYSPSSIQSACHACMTKESNMSVLPHLSTFPYCQQQACLCTHLFFSMPYIVPLSSVVAVIGSASFIRPRTTQASQTDQTHPSLCRFGDCSTHKSHFVDQKYHDLFLNYPKILRL